MKKSPSFEGLDYHNRLKYGSYKSSRDIGEDHKSSLPTCYSNPKTEADRQMAQEFAHRYETDKK